MYVLQVAAEGAQSATDRRKVKAESVPAGIRHGLWHPYQVYPRGLSVVTAVAALACSLGGVSSSSVSSTLLPSASVSLSNHRVRARPVAVTLQLHYEMQCGWPGDGPLVVTLPNAMPVPVAIARSAALIDGESATSVVVRGHRIVLALPPKPEVLCDVIALGTLTVKFTRAANLGNPNAPGRYRLSIKKSSLALSAAFVIRH
jgi:hypothetical protein